MTNHIPTREELMYGDKTAALEAELAEAREDAHKQDEVHRRVIRKLSHTMGDKRVELARLKQANLEAQQAWGLSEVALREAREERDAALAALHDLAYRQPKEEL